MSDDATPLFLLLPVIGGGLLSALVAKARRRSAVGLGILGAVFGAIPFVGWFFLLPMLLITMKEGDDGSEISTAAKTFAKGAQYAYAGGGTAIAVDTTRKIVRLKDGGWETKEYPFSEIREWCTNLSTGGQVLGYGLHAGSQAMGHNARVERENRKTSGLFVQVRDIGHPEWRIDMPSEQNQKRWMEIMRQTINND